MPASASAPAAAAAPFSSSSSSSSSSLIVADNLKKTKALTSAPKGPTPWLLLLPDITRDVLYSFLRNKDTSHLSAGSKYLLAEYGNRCKTLVLREHYPDDRTLSSLLSFAKRQKTLRKVDIDSDYFLPSVFFALGTGCFRHLQEIDFYRVRLSLSFSASFAAVIAKNTIPLLEQINMLNGAFEEGGIKALLQGLRTGACPRLHTLNLAYVFWRHTVDGSGQWEETGTVNQEETELNLAALADVLEERQRLGTCQVMKDIGEQWLGYGREETQARLLRLFLPLLENFSDSFYEWDNFSWGIQHANAFAAVPAPYLERLEVSSYAHLPLIDSLASMKSLDTLEFFNDAFDRASFSHFVALIRRHKDKPDFLANLKMLSLWNAIRQPETGDVGFSDLFRALEGRACAKSLERISIKKCGMSASGAHVLAALIENGSLPSLASLDLHGNGIGNEGVRKIISSCNVAGQIANLDISSVGLNDEGMQLLASTLKEAPLDILREFTLSGNEGITDAGAMHLVQAIKGGTLPKLTKLYLQGTNITANGAGALAAALLIHCPTVDSLYLPASINEQARIAIKGFFQGDRGVYVSFY